MIYFIGNNELVENSILYKTCDVETCLNYFKDKDWIEVDTETGGKDPHTKKIFSLQLGDTFNQYVIDVRFIDILLFKELLENKNLILHNAKFDYKFFKKANIIIEHVYDTMLAECVIYCGYEKFGYALNNLCKRYLDINLDKTTRQEFFKLEGQPFTAKQIEYAALDVAYLSLIKNKQEELIKEYDLTYCVNLENEAFKALADIEYNGMYLDASQWEYNTSKTQKELDDTQILLDNIIITDSILSSIYKPKVIQTNLFDFKERELKINYSSPKQMETIFKHLGYNLESTGDRELQKIASKHPFFASLINFRELSKVISTYGEGFLKYINKTTGKVHTSFWSVLATGRVSSGSKFDNAPNLQNIPADNKFRNCFKVKKGFKWVSIDYSGQELRLMADASGEEGFIDVLNRGEDLHCYAGSMMFKKTITKADKDLRNKAKTINFGKPYGMGPPKLADTLSISLEEANNLFEEYGKAFPVLNNWLKKQSQLAKKNMYSVTFSPCKRRRWYPEMQEAKNLRKNIDKYEKGSLEAKALWKQILTIEGQVERNGGNSPIQGSGADITKEALIEIRNLIKKYNSNYTLDVAYLICTVHDAIDVEVKEDLADQFSKDMAKIMIDCGNKYVTKVRMEVDITITDCWSK